MRMAMGIRVRKGKIFEVVLLVKNGYIRCIERKDHLLL